LFNVAAIRRKSPRESSCSGTIGVAPGSRKRAPATLPRRP